MRFTRKTRFITALFALMSVLFMQLAVAAYACPSLSAGHISSSNAASGHVASHEGMEGCEGDEPIDHASLCYAQAKFGGDQSLDKPVQPNFTPTVPFIAMPVIQVIEFAFRPASAPVERFWLRPASDPPLSIQHCCFRI